MAPCVSAGIAELGQVWIGCKPAVHRQARGGPARLDLPSTPPGLRYRADRLPNGAGKGGRPDDALHEFRRGKRQDAGEPPSERRATLVLDDHQDAVLEDVPLDLDRDATAAAATVVGRLRLRARGGSGGHNGLESIITQFGTEEIPRLRLGIGQAPAEGASDYVLSNFFEEEKTLVRSTIDRAAEAVKCAVDKGVVSAMNSFNKWKLVPVAPPSLKGRKSAGGNNFDNAVQPAA